MELSRKNLKNISINDKISIPTEDQFTLPEKVLQFGTGVLLRGLPDYFIDKANKQGLFNGRVVVVKSTDSGGTDAFDKQDGLFTQCVRGLENGGQINEYSINSSISRVLSAKNQWEEILAFARDPQLQLIISNTTELGIVPSKDTIKDQPPASFPGKLVAVLYERFKTLGNNAESGLVIVPTELIIDNGSKLKEIVLQLAQQNNLGTSFAKWLTDHNYFCNSLVDRIVPGKLEPTNLDETAAFLGYEDELMMMSEVFRLWAIQADSPRVNELLSFAQADAGVVIAANIEKFRELKLRLLNGTHTLSCALAYLSGFTTVKEAMADADFEAFVQELTKNELAPALQASGIEYKEACAYADSVIERFKNPFLDHKWLSISFAYTSKMLMRNLPLIKAYYSKPVQQPSAIALGFAAYILFMKSIKRGTEYQGASNGTTYVLNDDKAELLSMIWTNENPDEVVEAVLANKKLWSDDLTILTDFVSHVQQFLKELITKGAKKTVNKFVA